jgi:KUP system potassium uptake protein
VLSLIIYSFLLFTVIKIVFVALHANDDGDGQLITLLLVFFLTDGRQGLC